MSPGDDWITISVLAGATVASFCVEGVGTKCLFDVTHQALADRLRELMKILDAS